MKKTQKKQRRLPNKVYVRAPSDPLLRKLVPLLIYRKRENCPVEQQHEPVEYTRTK